MTRERGDAEDILRDAVLYRMLLLGEIASALPNELRAGPGHPLIVTGTRIRSACGSPVKADVIRCDASRARVAATERTESVSQGSVIDVDGGNRLDDGARALELVRHQRQAVSYLVTLGRISRNPQVSLGLDVTDLGRDIIRIEGTAALAAGFPAADQVPEYVVKYTERIGALFGTVEQFAARYSEALLITPRRLYA